MRLAAILFTLTLAAPAAAQDHSNHAGHAGQATPAAQARFGIDTPIETLVADAEAKAVLEANFPGITAHPAYPMFKSMSLKQLQPMSQGQVTDEKLAKASTELAAIR